MNTGESREEILCQYPSLTAEDIDSCLATGLKYIHVKELGEAWIDSPIWRYAQEQNLTGGPKIKTKNQKSSCVKIKK